MSARKHDEQVLAALRAYRRGEGIAAAAKCMGMSATRARQRLDLVIAEDCRADPEAHTYWFPDNTGAAPC